MAEGRSDRADGADDRVQLVLEIGRQLPRGHELREAAEARRVRAVREHLGKPRDEAGEVAWDRPPRRGASSSRPTMSSRPCTSRRSSERPVSTAWHSARIAAHVLHPTRREVAEVARIEEEREVHGHGSQRTRPCPPARGPPVASGPMRRPLLPLAAAALLVTVGCSSDDGAASGGCTPGPSLTVHAKSDLKFDATEYDTTAGCVQLDVHERRQHGAHPAHQGRVGLQAVGR